MRDVAKLARVSTMTVSRALHDSAAVTEETRLRNPEFEHIPIVALDPPLLRHARLDP